MRTFRYFLMIFGLVVLATNCNEPTSRDAVTIQSIRSPASEESRYAYLHHSGNTTSMSWLERIDSTRFALKVAIKTMDTWGFPESVVESDSFFVNWADFPSVVSYDGKPVAAHWLKKVPGGTYAYHVKISFRNMDGTWSPAITPHSDDTPTEHGFVSMIALDSDRILAIWLDGRNTVGGGHDAHSSHDSHDSDDENGVSDLSRAMTLRSAVVHRDGSLTDEHEIDDAICDCCQTSLAAVPGGAVVLYRDRSDREIRDIAVARYDMASGTWDTPRIIHNDGWKINGCPVNGPRLASNGNHVVAVWFTIGGEVAKVKAARSDDGGLTFGDAVIVDQGRTNGRVDIVLDATNTAWISWLGSEDDQPKLAIRKWPNGADLGDTHYIGEADTRRGSGFPRMVWTDGGILMATTKALDGYQVILNTIQWD